MKAIGFTQGRASPCTFHHKERNIRTYIHGDDYVSVGTDHDLKWLRKRIEEKYELKTQVLGPTKGDSQQVKVLNRVLRWTEQGIEYEAVPRHAEIIIKDLNLDKAKGVSSPGTKEEGRTKENCKDALNDDRASEYRAIVAKMNYLAADRPDIAFSVKEAAREMSKPTIGGCDRLKRIGRYLCTRPRLVKIFKWQVTPKQVTIYIDADWAGCKESRKSTSGGCIVWGEHTIKSWSETQSLIALSSGGSEFYAALKASAEALGAIAMLKDFGVDVAGKVMGDASAALGIIHRKGLGRTRHIDTGLLWIQQTAAEKRLEYAKVLGAENLADLMTKYLTQEVSERHCAKLNLQFEDGRAELAPHLASVYVSKAYWEIEEEEEESDEDQGSYDEWSQLQSVVNQVWHSKWKQVAKNSFKIKGNLDSGINGGDGAMPPLIPLPQTSIKEYAVQKGLLKRKVITEHGRRGPTRESEIPIPIWGIL